MGRTWPGGCHPAPYETMPNFSVPTTLAVSYTVRTPFSAQPRSSHSTLRTHSPRKQQPSDRSKSLRHHLWALGNPALPGQAAPCGTRTWCRLPRTGARHGRPARHQLSQQAPAAEQTFVVKLDNLNDRRPPADDKSLLTIQCS